MLILQQTAICYAHIFRFGKYVPLMLLCWREVGGPPHTLFEFFIDLLWKVDIFGLADLYPTLFFTSLRFSLDGKLYKSMEPDRHQDFLRSYVATSICISSFATSRLSLKPRMWKTEFVNQQKKYLRQAEYKVSNW